VTKIIRIGLDASKSVFVPHGVDATEQPVLRKKLRRSQVLEFFAKLEPTERLEAEMMAWHKHNEVSRRLIEIPGIGPIGAILAAMKVPNPQAFSCGCDFSASLGLTKDHSTAGKTRLGAITRAGDEALRNVLVAGATAVIQHVRRGQGRPSPWLLALLQPQAVQACGDRTGE
jgi:transposase